jgi:hypothetical protein
MDIEELLEEIWICFNPEDKQVYIKRYSIVHNALGRE